MFTSEGVYKNIQCACKISSQFKKSETKANGVLRYKFVHQPTARNTQMKCD